MSEFDELCADLRLGQEVREQRERAAQAQSAAFAKALTVQNAAAEAARERRHMAKLLKDTDEAAEKAATLARELNPSAQLKEKVREAEAGIAQALAQGKYDTAMKLEWHRNNFASRIEP